MAGFRAHALAIGGRGTVSRKGGPNIAESNGQGGPLSAGDQIFRDRPPRAKLYTSTYAPELTRATR